MNTSTFNLVHKVIITVTVLAVASLGYFGGASADLPPSAQQKAEYRTNVINTPAVQAELELLKARR
jgi:hypothetical protein|nr:MAG TPA: hypothetical protein [Caudoviricetes sp.]